MRRLWHIIVTAFALTGASAVAEATRSSRDEEAITIFAAASLIDILSDQTEAWSATSAGRRTNLSVAASAVLARQIEAGAEADIFISANRRWIDYLAQEGHTEGAAVPVATNALVFAVPCDGTIELGSISLREIVTQNRFIMADPNVSPAGEYARSALMGAGLWDNVSQNAAFAANARRALALIERGGQPGFVYRSDAAASKLACEAMEIPLPEDQKIEYLAVITSRSSVRAALARRLIAWLVSAQAATTWRQHHFAPVVPN